MGETPGNAGFVTRKVSRKKAISAVGMPLEGYTRVLMMAAFACEDAKRASLLS